MEEIKAIGWNTPGLVLVVGYGCCPLSQSTSMEQSSTRVASGSTEESETERSLRTLSSTSLLGTIGDSHYYDNGWSLDDLNVLPVPATMLECLCPYIISCYHIKYPGPCLVLRYPLVNTDPK